MSEVQNSSNGGNLILLGAGLLCLLCGFAMISEGTSFASMFLGARFLFGFPLSDADRLKALFVEGGGLLIAGQGAVLSLAGFFRLVRNGAPQEAAVKPVGS
jgi:hypothetical protein